VPADRAHELEAELTPVLALLDAVDAECARIVAQARHDARRIVAAAREEAAAQLRGASRNAAAAKEEEVRQVVAAAQAEAVGAVAEARREALQTRELAGQRIPMLASRAVDLVRALGGGDPGPAGRGHDRRGKSGWPT
jgi:vacuolar-type H+-ATPase subunit H